MSTRDVIDKHVQGITDALRVEVENTLARLRQMEKEAADRLAALSATPDEYDYQRAANYLGIPKRTLELRVAQRAIAFRKDGRRVFFTRGALDDYRATLNVARRPVRPLSL